MFSITGARLNHERKKLAVLISGRGSNMVALADAVDEGRIPGAEIALVLSDHSGAAGLARAAGRGIETLAIERRGRTRGEHEREIAAALLERAVDLVCLAGFMRLLSPRFVEAFRGRILNIHPSLLPAFPGLDAQRQAIEHGVKFSGCTVHFVDETLDGGAIIAQRVVAVGDDDTPETLAARILAEEHEAYPAAVALVLSGDYELNGRRVVPRARAHN
ncbi:MAG TPA: phosphoribosylglycinamide formyltransferase [Pyrinomonadaceae bacterium]|jgi:phosphoribosylglycinamide formyltransferase-1|nr:phosphoribosylglycinamide formyltransferase [Pyrinomonadaceae bacterium]